MIKINGTEYFVQELPFSSTKKAECWEPIREAFRLGGFMQGFSEVKPGLLVSYSIVRMFIPAKRFVEWRDYQDRETLREAVRDGWKQK